MGGTQEKQQKTATCATNPAKNDSKTEKNYALGTGNMDWAEENYRTPIKTS